MGAENHRFSAWDGTQDPWGDAAESDLFDQIAEAAFHGWDVESALRRLLGQGWRDSMGRPLMGLEEMTERLRRRRQQALERFNLDDIFADITEKLDAVVRMEREGIKERLSSADADALRVMARVAEQRNQQLDDLPLEPSGALRELRNYEFLDPRAQSAFERLLAEVQASMRETYFSQISQSLRATDAEELPRLRAMTHDLHALVRGKLEGLPEAQLAADYARFREQYRDFFPNAPESFDEFLNQLQEQMARMDSLMQSLPEEQRRELEQLAQQAFGDAGLQAEMAALMAALEMLSPRARLGTRYSFMGDEPAGLSDAMQLMDQLQSMESLERALRDVYRGDRLDDAQRQRVRELLGNEAARSLDHITEMTGAMLERGLLERGDGGLELTARGMRRIGQKALGDIFTHLARDRFGDHALSRRGDGGERTDESKPYAFGDPFDLDVTQTVMNSVLRQASDDGSRGQLEAADFAVHASETKTRAATVLMLDMSRSMPLRGYFYAAKKVALALDSLIRSQYPRDSLYIVGFSDYAREIAPSALPQLSVNEYVYGTNLQHGLMLARRLLARHRGATKQIIIVSDGEPTAHIEDGHAVFFYPPLPETFERTLVEVRRCTREQIVINTFMLESNRHLVQFVNQMTKLNRGRVFFISADRLGDYVLVDYVKSRRGGAAA